MTLLVALAPAAASAQESPTTYPGPSYGASLKPGPSADKPQSKLWYHDGAWWALLLADDQRFHVFRLADDHTWSDTGTIVDDRSSSRADVLADGDHVYVASRSSSGPVRLYRLSYDEATGRYANDSGFPVDVSTHEPESVTIAKDSTGRLWITYTANSKLWIAHSTTGDADWSAPVQPAVPDATVASDDISAIVHMGDRVGVMWSDQPDDSFRFATHVDGAPDDEWSAETALSSPGMADDHINLKVGSDGRLFAAVKTSQTDSSAPSIMLLVRGTDGGWASHVYATVAERLTRPIVGLDESSERAFVFAARESGGDTIYYKMTPSERIEFGPGRGAPFLTDPNADDINNPTIAGHAVGSGTGVVVLASDATAERYHHAELALGPADTLAPTTPSGLAAEATGPSSVELAWEPASDDVGVAGYTIYRDGQEVGTSSTASFTDDTAAPETGYTYTVDAVDAAGNRSAQSDPAEATTAAEPTAGTAAIEFRDAAFGANAETTTLDLPVPDQVAAGDTMVAAIDVRGSPQVSAPAGWQLVRQDENGFAIKKAVFVRRAGSSEPGSYTWTLSKPQAASGAIAAYTGVSSVTPVDADGGQVNDRSTSVIAPSITTSVPGTRLVGLFGVNRDTAIAPPSDMAERGEIASTDGSYEVATEVADVALADAAETGARTATAAKPAKSGGVLVALRPE